MHFPLCSCESNWAVTFDNYSCFRKYFVAMECYQNYYDMPSIFQLSLHCDFSLSACATFASVTRHAFVIFTSAPFLALPLSWLSIYYIIIFRNFLNQFSQRFGIGIGDWGFDLGIGEWDWGLEIGMGWDWGLGLGIGKGIGIGDWDWVFGIGCDFWISFLVVTFGCDFWL